MVNKTNTYTKNNADVLVV